LISNTVAGMMKYVTW